MGSHWLASAPLVGLCLLQAPIVLAQTAQSSTQRTPFEAIPGPPQPPPPKVLGPPIQAIQFQAVDFQGAVRSSQILRAIIESHAGGAYDPETLRRDAQALYKTGRFSSVVWETEQGSVGPIVRFEVVERPLIQSIEYQGNDTVTIPEILERFKQRKVKLRAETLLNEDELSRAVLTLQGLVAEGGRRNITVTPLVEPIAPSTVKITFRVEEKQ
jgi:outer membrane protein assembly factor BamA